MLAGPLELIGNFLPGIYLFQFKIQQQRYTVLAISSSKLYADGETIGQEIEFGFIELAVNYSANQLLYW